MPVCYSVWVDRWTLYGYQESKLSHTSLFVQHGDIELLDGGVNTGAGGAPGRGGSVLVEG